VAISFIGGGNWSTRRKLLTCRNSLTNCITYGVKGNLKVLQREYFLCLFKQIIHSLSPHLSITIFVFILGDRNILVYTCICTFYMYFDSFNQILQCKSKQIKNLYRVLNLSLMVNGKESRQTL
jgi:hypothetical protein